MDISVVLDNVYAAYRSTKRSHKKRTALESLIVDEYNRCLEDPTRESTKKFADMGASVLGMFAVYCDYERLLDVVLRNEIRERTFNASVGCPSAMALACYAIAMKKPKIGELVRKLVELQNKTVEEGPHAWSGQRQFESAGLLLAHSTSWMRTGLSVEEETRDHVRKANLMDFMRLCRAAMVVGNFTLIKDVIWKLASDARVNCVTLMLSIVRSAAVCGNATFVRQAIQMAKENRISELPIAYLWSVAFMTVRGNRFGTEHSCRDVKNLLAEWIGFVDRLDITYLSGWGEIHPCKECDAQVKLYSSSIDTISQGALIVSQYYGLEEPYSLHSTHHLPGGEKLDICLHFDPSHTDDLKHDKFWMLPEKQCPHGSVNMVFSQ